MSTDPAYPQAVGGAALTQEMADSNRVLAAVNAAQASFIASRPTREIFEDVLVSFLDLTGSSSGIVHDGVETVASYGPNGPGTSAAEVTGIALPLRSGGTQVGKVELFGRGGYSQTLLDDIEPLVRTAANLLRARNSERARVEAEEALGGALEAAHAANQASSRMLSRMSHELRTPLNAVMGFAQLLALEELTDDAQDSVDHILAAGRNLLGLVDEVLDITDIESRGGALRTEEIDLVALARSVGDRSSSPGRVQVVGGGSAHSDRELLGRALGQVLDNALRFSTRDVVLECSSAALRVQDAGVGMTPEQVARFQDAFERSKDSRASTGLGMTLVASVTKLLGMGITVESEVGKGTTVTLEL